MHDVGKIRRRFKQSCKAFGVDVSKSFRREIAIASFNHPRWQPIDTGGHFASCRHTAKARRGLTENAGTQRELGDVFQAAKELQGVRGMARDGKQGDVTCMEDPCARVSIFLRIS